jgi:hypothetical protein
MSRRNEALLAALAELEERGIPFTVEVGRHLKVRWADGMVIVASTPSSRRAALKARATVRRLLRRGAS